MSRTKTNIYAFIIFMFSMVCLFQAVVNYELKTNHTEISNRLNISEMAFNITIGMLRSCRGQSENGEEKPEEPRNFDIGYKI